MEEDELLIQAELAAESVMRQLSAQSRTLALVESCTAGLVSSLLARVPGASSVLWGSFVPYTREAKIFMLGIESGELPASSLVSEKTAALMAGAALRKSGADIAASVTGLAGPEGDGGDAAVGTVWTAAALRDGTAGTREYHFTGSRNAVRLRAAIAVFETLSKTLPNDLT